MKFFSLEMSDIVAAVGDFNSKGLNKLRKMAQKEGNAEAFAEVNALYGQKCAEEYRKTGKWTCN